MRIRNSLHYDSLDISVFYMFVEYGACEWMHGARWDLCTWGKAEHTRVLPPAIFLGPGLMLLLLEGLCDVWNVVLHCEPLWL